MTDIIDIDNLKKTLKEFADVRDWNKFHNPKNLSMALSCESAELLEIFQWMSDKDASNAYLEALIQEKAREELADIMLYVVRIASLMNINLASAVKNKISINNKKYPAELVKGSAKKYSEY